MTTPNLTATPVAHNSGLTIPLTKEHRRWLKGSRDPVAAYVSQKLLCGLRPQTVEQLMRSVNHRCAAIVDGFAALGDTVRLTRFLAPIDAALARIKRPAFCIELVKKESEADAAESVAKDVLLVAPTREHAITFLRRSQAARAAAIELEIAVARKWEIA